MNLKIIKKWVEKIRIGGLESESGKRDSINENKDSPLCSEASVIGESDEMVRMQMSRWIKSILWGYATDMFGGDYLLMNGKYREMVTDLVSVRLAMHMRLLSLNPMLWLDISFWFLWSAELLAVGSRWMVQLNWGDYELPLIIRERVLQVDIGWQELLKQ